MQKIKKKKTWVQQFGEVQLMMSQLDAEIQPLQQKSMPKETPNERDKNKKIKNKKIKK